MKVQCFSFICTGNNVFGASCSGSILQFGTKRRHGLSCAVQIYGIFCSLSQVTALLLKMPSLRRGIFCSLTLLYQNTHRMIFIVLIAVPAKLAAALLIYYTPVYPSLYAFPPFRIRPARSDFFQLTPFSYFAP